MTIGQLRTLGTLCLAGLFAAGCTHEQPTRPDAPAPQPTEPALTKVPVYTDGEDEDPLFVPTGKLGDFEDAVEADPGCAQDPHEGKACFKVAYDGEGDAGWAGLYWVHPEDNWGEVEGRDLTGAQRLTFWARGEKGGEVVAFKVGGIPGPKPDTAEAATPKLTLTPFWNQFTINLSEADLSNVVGGFAFTVTAKDNPKGCTFYLDDIAYVARR